MTRPNVPILLHPKRLRRRGPSGAPTILAMNSSHGSGSRVGHRAPTWSWTWKWKIHENTWNVLYKWNFPAIYKYKQTYIYIYAVYVCICIYIYHISYIYNIYIIYRNFRLLFRCPPHFGRHEGRECQQRPKAQRSQRSAAPWPSGAHGG